MKNVPYANAIGKIMYAMVCSRPDISHDIIDTIRLWEILGKETGIMCALSTATAECIINIRGLVVELGMNHSSVSVYYDCQMHGLKLWFVSAIMAAVSLIR
jgi:hypothetical protein